jgi:SAM-dependent methyltransferase
MFDLLEREGILSPDAVVADVGSGTGILSRGFLDRGHRVYGVEPNTGMREAAERLLDGEERFTSVDGRAEATTLPAGAVDLVAAGQAFHWFDPSGARAEFRRILRNERWVVLVWNVRRIQDVPAMTEYQELVDRYARDPDPVTYRSLREDDLRSFYGGWEYRLVKLESSQALDLDGLRGRLMSSSYAPEPGDPVCASLFEDLERLFSDHARDGLVTFEYETRLYYGRLNRGEQG